MNNIVLAFDIERSGGGCENHTIGIGACVVDSEFNELDRLFLPGYIQEETVFEDRCWDEFWSKFPDKLDILKYEGDLNMVERQREMTEQFQDFRSKWEKYAENNGIKYEIVSDNNVYDGGFINMMLFAHVDTLPLPYNTSQKYKPYWETHSEQRGLLMAVDPSYKKNSGFTKKIEELYDIPEMKVEHDHNPANDAYTIAFEQQVLNGIRDGTVRRKQTTKKMNILQNLPSYSKMGKLLGIAAATVAAMSMGSRMISRRSHVQ